MAALRKAVQLADPFTLALLDADLAGLAGMELARQIAANPSLNRTLLVMMRGAGDRCSAGQIEELALAGCLTKPVLESRLRQALDLALGGKASREPVQATSVKRGALTRAAVPARILVAEDIVPNQEVALAILSKLGHHADAAGTGVAALAAMEAESYDLILMDCELPEVRSLDTEATQRIRQNEALTGKPRIPIVALTAHASLGRWDKCFDSGIDRITSKPIDPRQLAASVQKCVSRSRAGAIALPAPKGPGPGEAVAAFDETGFSERLIGDRSVAGKVLAAFQQDIPG